MGISRKGTTASAVIAGIIISAAGFAAWANGDLNPGFAGIGAGNIDFTGNDYDALQVGFQNAADQSLLLAGREHKPSAFSTAGFIAKLSSEGSLSGNKIVVDLASEFVNVTGVSVPADGTVFFTGTNGATNTLKLVRTDAAGAITGRYTRPPPTGKLAGNCRNVIYESSDKAATSCIVASSPTADESSVGIVRVNTTTATFTADTTFGTSVTNKTIGTAFMPPVAGYPKAVPPSANTNLLRDAAGNYYLIAIVVTSDTSKTNKGLAVVTKYDSTGTFVTDFGNSTPKNGLAVAAVCDNTCVRFGAFSVGLDVDDFVLDGSGGLLIASTTLNAEQTAYHYYLTRLNATTGVPEVLVEIPGGNDGNLRPTAVLPTASGIYVLRRGNDVIRLKNDGTVDSYTAFGTSIAPLNRKANTDVSRWFGTFKLDEGNALLLGGVSEQAATTTSSQATVAKFRFAADETPDGFVFTALTDQATGVVVKSNAITVSGLSVGVQVPISVSAGQYSIGCTDAGFTSTAGTIQSGQTVCVRHTTAATASTPTLTTLTIGGVAGTFSSTTAAPASDTTPDAYAFTAQTGLAVNVPVTSNTTTITGINAPAPISISGGIGAGYSIGCNGTFTSTAGTISNGQTVCVQQTTAATTNTAAVTTLSVGGVTAAFSATTAPAPSEDTIPEPYAFTAQTDKAPSTAVTSNTVTITGINAPAPISISGGTGSGYSIGCNGTFTSAAGTINNGETVCVRLTSAAAANAVTSTTLSVGGVTAGFQVTTVGTLSVNPTSLDFGSQEVGTSSAPRSFQLANSGPPVSLSGIAASGEYAVTHNCPATLETSAACTINVTFAPTTEGSHQGAITIASNAAAGALTVPLSGSGTTTIVATLAPSTLTFDARAAGTTSDARFATLTNTGTSSLTYEIATEGEFTAQASSCTSPLPPQVSCSIAVRFSPTSAGAKAGSLLVTTSTQGTLVAALSGSGLSSVTLQTDRGPVALTTSQGVVSSFTAAAAPPNAPVGYTYPVGFFNYQITGLPTDGDPAEVVLTLTLPEGAAFNTYVKCKDGVCSTLDGIEVNGRVLTMRIRDNSVVDSDAARGSIIDPGAPALTGDPGSPSDSGGGAMSWWVLMLMGLPALLRRRRA